MSESAANGQSWGRYPSAAQEIQSINWASEIPQALQAGTALAQGLGRSYGDSCLNHGGKLLLTSGLDRFIAFDREHGILECEAGVSLAEILRLTVPQGWFLPVVPGTKFVTVGGAIANDIHGKNHHSAGTFGLHVKSLDLIRSDGSRLRCSAESQAELFAATIAGLGLTGIIVSAVIQLKKISGPWIQMESIKFRGLDEFFSISGESDRTMEYTVAWLDCVSSGKAFARGIFMRGNHSARTGSLAIKDGGLVVPCNAPGWCLSRPTVSAFNFVYFHKQLKDRVSQEVGYHPFFFPLDSVRNWNRIYGKRGFVQFQCVVPPQDKHLAIEAILKRVVASGEASFLAVLKEFGDHRSPGMLSFPRPGTTLCLDFPMRGQKTIQLMADLDRLVREARGAMYPAKDACMSPESFKQYFPKSREFEKFIDPAFSSSFWRRVHEAK